MSAKELLEAATPLPWTALIDDPEDGTMFITADPEETQFACAGERIPPQNALLVEYAVNRLPDYEAAVDALERLIAMFDGNVVGNALVMHASDCMTEAEGLIDGTISCTCGADEPLADAETALARLRGTP